MSVRIMTLVWDSNLEPNLRYVALAYADICNDDGEGIYASYDYLAEKTGLARRSVIRLAARLREDGILQDQGASKRRTKLFKFDPAKLTPRPPKPSRKGDSVSPLIVTQSHPSTPDGDTESPLTVTQSHPIRESNRESEMNREKNQQGSGACADTPVASQPVQDRPLKKATPPEIKWFREIVGRYPPRALYDRVVEVITARQDADLLRLCHETWVGKGWNPNNLAWFFEWYAAGAIPNRNANGSDGRAHGNVRMGATYEELKAYYVPAQYEDIFEY